mmetsp:Transcript_41652/g.102480  ORF Transcript_41652/g.102480 Transcript_41652/m.102480 type:complete len:211 (-) Transcript_41652:1179-1811(-)
MSSCHSAIVVFTTRTLPSTADGSSGKRNESAACVRAYCTYALVYSTVNSDTSKPASPLRSCSRICGGDKYARIHCACTLAVALDQVSTAATGTRGASWAISKNAASTRSWLSRSRSQISLRPGPRSCVRNVVASTATSPSWPNGCASGGRLIDENTYTSPGRASVIVSVEVDDARRYSMTVSPNSSAGCNVREARLYATASHGMPLRTRW